MTYTYNIDCMEAMAQMKDNEFDLSLVDPPYGIGADQPSKKKAGVRQKNGKILNVKIASYGKKYWDIIPSKKYFNELIRVSKNQIIWGINYFNISNIGPGRIVWDKMNDESHQFDCEIAYCSINNRTDLVYYMWAGMLQGRQPSRKLSIAYKQIGNKSLNESHIHPTQKPIILYKWLLKNYVKEGDTILDTHLGSQSSRIAAHDMGFDFTGYEIDADYFNAGEKRFQNHIQQLSVFQSKDMYT